MHLCIGLGAEGGRRSGEERRGEERRGGAAVLISKQEPNRRRFGKKKYQALENYSDGLVIKKLEIKDLDN